MKKYSPFVLMVLFWGNLFGQPISYSFSDTTMTYAQLTGAVDLWTGSDWDSSFSVQQAEAFPFDFYGQALLSDTLIIQPNSIKEANSVGHYVSPAYQTQFIDYGAFDGFHGSPISYKLDGTSPDRIMKFEWQKMAFKKEYQDSGSTDQWVNWQVWLRETSNIIEIHYGGNTVTSTWVWYNNGPSVRLGELSGAYFSCLSGNPLAPSFGSTCTPLNSLPDSGTVYIFTPVPVSREKDLAAQMLGIFPNPANEFVAVQSRFDHTGLGLISINDLQGKTIHKEIPTLKASKHELNLSGIPPGLYLLNWESSEGRESGKLIVE